MKKWCVAIGLIWMLIPNEVMAGSHDGDTADGTVDAGRVVVTATMTEKQITDAPGAVEVITRQEMIEMNAQTVADAVADATGLVVTTETGRQKRPSIRGTGSNHTLLLIDGRRLASGFKDLLGIEQIPMDMVQRIEVVRGPTSALYGSDAIGGVINIITKTPPKELSAGLTAQYGQSTYNEGQEVIGSAVVGNTWDRLGVLLAGGYRDKDGYDRDGVTPDDGDDMNLSSGAGRLSFDINRGHRLLAGLEAVDKNNTGLRDLQSMDRERDADYSRLNYFLEYDGHPTSLTSLMLRANHSEQENDIEITPATSMIAGSIGDENNSKRRLDQVEARFNGLFFDRHLVTVGGEYREEGREDDTGMDDDIDNVSGYLQDEYRIFDPFLLVVGVRYDDHSDFGSQWTPRASLTYNVVEHLRLKASYGEGFRAPGFMELYVPTYMKRGKLVYEPNAELDPETSQSYEIGIEGEYKRFSGQVMAFKTSIDDMIEAVYYASTGSGNKKKDYYQYQNIGEVTMSGVELQWGLGLPMGFDLSGNLAYLDTENEDTGEELEGRPDYNGSLKLGYHHAGMGLRANLRLNYIGERYYADEPEKDVTLLNAYLSKTVFDNVMLFAGVDNIFNAGSENDIEPTFYYAGVSLKY
ncbi:TonB-dependent receptor plug domain-containing protein [Desulfosarcina ovata]|uniref:Receptor n=1 Tax=Desulfosarcina ovata subsp. ovata TaxID=2752305 RepID=A0A5K8AD62_9BACT|nr:TonB-dependent receptor [Desulfosarcina ovata]BBO90575.1 receptor [Desulfosarcina ovata subsp. ovata]